ncbi:MAG: hypothetical protein HPY79_09755 [Bacteroidales bacterium]|nr:hypothetical protein [Bacteroidales bacterium]
MRQLFFILIFLISTKLIAQNTWGQNSLIETTDTIGYSVCFNSLYTTQTNGFNKKFIQAVNQSQYLSDDLKTSNPLKAYNYLFYNLNEEISFYHMPDSLLSMEKTGYHVGISYKQLFTSAFNNDLFNIIAFGNKMFAGKDADLSQSLFQYYDYGTLSLGLYKVFEDENTITKAIFDFNVHAFKDIQYLYIPNASLYTADDGSYINFKLRGTYQAKNNHSFDTPGISFNAGISLYNKSSHTLFSFQVKQLGVAFLINQSYHATIDTMVHYEGIQIDNIISNPQYNAGILSNDSLSQLYNNHMDTNSSVLTLPETMMFSIHHLFEHKIFSDLQLGLSYQFHTKQKSPEFFISQSIKINSKIKFAIGSSYGGYNSLSPFIYAEFRFNTHNILHFNFANPLSYLIKDYPYNTTLFLSFRRYW